MAFTRVLLVGAALILLALPADAAELKLEFRDGTVTLIAQDVSLRQILSEWAKVGRTQIVNGDRVSTTPVTLQIDGLPERQALEVILRSVAGYVAAPRKPGNAGPSVYDRILVLAVSNPPAPAATRATPPPMLPTPRVATPMPPAPLAPPPNDDGDDNIAPRPGAQPPGVPAVPQIPGVAQPFSRPPSSTPVYTPGGGSSIPGVVIPAQPQPGQPANPPPGQGR